MADDEVAVKVTADSSGAAAGVKGLTDEVKKLQESVSGIGEGVESFKDKLLEAFTLDKIIEFVSGMMETATAVEKLTAALGTSAETVQAFNLAGQAVGVSVTEISESMTTLERTVIRAGAGIERSQAALNTFGLQARDFIGLNFEQKFALLADRVSQYRDSTEKTAAITAILGSAGASLIPILNQGAEGLQKYNDIMQRTSSAATPEFLASMSQLDDSTIEFKAAMLGAGESVLTVFAPAINSGMVLINDLIEAFTNSQKSGGAFKTLLEDLATAMKVLESAGVGVVLTIKELWDVLMFVPSEGRSGLAKLADQMEADAKSARVEFDKIWSAPVPTPKAEGGGGDKNAQYQQANRDKAASMMAFYDADVKAAQMDYAEKATILDQEVALHRITANDKFAILEQYSQQEYATELAALQQELQIGGLRVSQQQQIMNKIRQLRAQHEQDMVNLNKQSIQAQIQEWSQYTNTVASSFNSQLRGILTGQTTFSQAMKNILLDLSLKTVELLVTKPVSEFIAGQLAMLTANTTVAGERAAADVAASEAALPAKIASFTSDLTSRAALTFAGVFANLAPLLGPAAAGPAAASEATVLAQAAAVPKFDVGAWSVPATGLAVIHKGETILPAGAPADAYRAQMSGGAGTGSGGGGLGELHLHIHALDAADLDSYMRRGGAAKIAKHVSAYQDKNPSSRPQK